MSLHKNLK